ncbi:MAG: uroporphyrinogen-III C-methyltransferase [Pseudanabaenaceae cyanobacterium SKYGB_i_bin29]|nr:uroporphyrinogen-III C-methyltransferase [Pseudanabaenaceae cyanobacterium SKYG29]MDW8422288.1 uroporphyrinogen-III C-methyltransferase [Pseudanabaenaceae cyanobacterium SKYGB_i_bin29]
MKGKVYLVGAGPGDPELITLKGKRLLESCDVVVYDALVSEGVLALINPQADRYFVGKRRGRHTLLQEETTALLIKLADSHDRIVRLKGGDPFVFGRGGEEMADLLRAGIAVEVVPGITAGIAVPAYAGIPITHREFSSSVTFVTGHEAAGKYRPSVNWQAIAQGSETIVIYMGLHNLPTIVPTLLEAGLSPQTPVAVLQQGTLPEQVNFYCTLGTVLDMGAKLEPPAIVVIGKVVALAPELRGLGNAPSW